MIWLAWRQQRTHTLVTAALTLALVLLLIITGRQMSSDYHHALSTCAASGSCDKLQLFQGSGYSALSAIVTLTVAVPALFGLLWGAPLVASELEQGTHQFIWTQSVSRRRWIAVKVGWVLLAAAVWGGAIATAVTWWSATHNSMHHDRFSSSLQFDIQGVVPVAYAILAVALGLTAGAVFKRLVPALVATLAAFGTLLLVLQNFVRPHYLPDLTKTLPLDQATTGLTASSWIQGGSILDPSGKVIGGINDGGGWYIHAAPPANCPVGDAPGRTTACLSSDGYRALIHYQPASRYWTFQFIESAILLTLAALLIAATLTLITRRDA